MKLIYIHIPKTAGSSISKVLAENAPGFWLPNSALNQLAPDNIWGADFLAGHFTREEILSWVAQHQLDLSGVKFVTVIRHPLEQLQSNLSFPYELKERGAEIEEPWMREMLSVSPDSPSEISGVLQRFPWLLNLQWQYVVKGSYPEEALSAIDHVAVYPAVVAAMRYCCETLGFEAPVEQVHENRSARYAIERGVFAQSPLREVILERHALDITLFSEVLVRKLRRIELDAIVNIHPLEPGRLLDSWAARRTVWPCLSNDQQASPSR